MILKKKSEKAVRELSDTKADKLIDIDKFEVVKHYLLMLNKGYSNFLIIKGRAGLGKSYSVINILRKLKTPFEYRSGYITPLSLYQLLYKYNKMLLVLDDVEGLFENKCVALLKSALWDINGKRIVSYETTHKKLMGNVPSVFDYQGKLVILANELKSKKDENFNALISRAVNYELLFSFKEIMAISDKILSKKKLNKVKYERVKDIIQRNITPISNFNFRILDRLVQMVRYNKDKAEELFLASLQQDTDMELVLKLMRKKLSVGEQIRQFSLETGKSRRTYFVIKKKIKELV